ncbi:unnamed protein product [Cunninghamella blakesleeana]
MSQFCIFLSFCFSFFHCLNMSSRALRQLQKKELEIEEPNISEEESDEYEPPSKAQNLFDLLNEGDDEEEEEEEIKKEEKDVIVEEEEEEEEEELKTPPPSKVNNKNKSTKKKNKKKQQQKKRNIEDMSMKELDNVLNEIQQKDKQKTASKPDTNNNNNKDNSIDSSNPEFNLSSNSRQLLNVNYRYLDAESEMKRMFGSRIVNREARPSGKLLKKTKLATPKSDWPMYKKQGLSMEVLNTINNTSFYSFKHQGSYQDEQAMYLTAVAHHDVNAIIYLHRKHPYQIDVLLQLSDIASQQNDRTASGDFIDRALYACERAFHPHFTFGTGSSRLPYKKSENRSFFVTIVRNIQFLRSRGCWRTAFEFNKLLFSLSPFDDPTGAILSLDYFALFAKEYQYVLDFVKNWKTDNQIYPTDVSFLPNFAFSAAYAKFKQHQLQQSDNNKKNDNGDDTNDQDKDGSIILKKSISLFPGMIPRLLQALDVTDSVVDLHLDYFTKTKIDDYLSLLFALYVDRAYELWKEPEVLEWLKKNIHEVLTDTTYHGKAFSKLPCQQKKKSIPLNVSRHILFLNRRELMSLLPSNLSLDSFHASDPLPPEDSETGYDVQERMHATRHGPWPRPEGGVLNLIQDLIGRADTHPELRQRLNRMFGDVTPGDGIPGAFPVNEGDTVYDDLLYDDDYDDEFDDDDDDEFDMEQYASNMAARQPVPNSQTTTTLNNENRDSAIQQDQQNQDATERSNQ